MVPPQQKIQKAKLGNCSRLNFRLRPSSSGVACKLRLGNFFLRGENLTRLSAVPEKDPTKKETEELPGIDRMRSTPDGLRPERKYVTATLEAYKWAFLGLFFFLSFIISSPRLIGNAINIGDLARLVAFCCTGRSESTSRSSEPSYILFSV